jgi:hypothetical protein
MTRRREGMRRARGENDQKRDANGADAFSLSFARAASRFQDVASVSAGDALAGGAELQNSMN